MVVRQAVGTSDLASMTRSFLVLARGGKKGGGRSEVPPSVALSKVNFNQGRTEGRNYRHQGALPLGVDSTLALPLYADAYIMMTHQNDAGPAARILQVVV